jgi:hypothetical protein
MPALIEKILGKTAMNISDYIESYGHKALRDAAKKAGVNYQYLLQARTGRNGEIPVNIGLFNLRKLLALDVGFTVRRLRPDIYNLVKSEIEREGS